MVNYTKEVKDILKQSEKEAISEGLTEVTSIHLLKSLLKINTCIKPILINNNITIINEKKKQINPSFPITYTETLKEIIESSHILINNYEESNIISLTLSILDTPSSKAYKYIKTKTNIKNLYNQIKQITNNNESYINKIGINLNEQNKNASNTKAYNRTNELNEIIQILSRKNKNNPILIGEAGVGKTAIVEELSRLISLKEVPPNLINKEIIMINISDIISGTKYRGEFEEKLNNIIKEACSNENIILFIDEIHTIIGAGGAEGAIDAANILKPELARGNLKIIGATTPKEYNESIKLDKALDRRFQKVIIKEPTTEETIKILNKIKKEYEDYHNVKIDKSIIDIIPILCKKYIPNRYEPDKSIDIIDEVCSRSKINNCYLNIKEINKKISDLNIIKLKNINTNNYIKAINIDKEIKTLKNKEKQILYNKKYNIVNKEILYEVLKEKTNTEIYELNKINIKNKLKYINNINTNELINNIENHKTIKINIDDEYIIKTISDILKRNIIVINGNEYQDETSITKFIGTTAGYIGYDNQNTIYDKLYDNPNSILKIINKNKMNNKIKEIINNIEENQYIINNKNEKLILNNLIIIEATKQSIKNKIGFITKEKIKQ